MKNFSLLVQRKYSDLSAEQQQIFDDEFTRRKRSVGTAYILWFFLGWHYAYVNKWALLLLYIITLGGFAIWAIVDLFRIPKIIADYNNTLAVEILRDITLMFARTESVESYPSLGSLENDFKVLNFDVKRKSDISYLPVVLLALFVVFVGLSAVLKPDSIKIGNKVVDKMLENNPDMVIIAKNLFFGTEMKEEHVANFITNSLSKSGYSNIAVQENDWVIIRKLEVVDVESNSNLITAYGFWDKTFVKLNYKNMTETSEATHSAEIPETKIHQDQDQDQFFDMVDMVVIKDLTYLYSKDAFANNKESQNYRILKLNKGDIVTVLHFGLLDGDMHKVRINKGGSLYEGFVVDHALDYLQ